MPPCWQCSTQKQTRIAVASVQVHDETRVDGVTVQVKCHGETATITLRNFPWPPKTSTQAIALQNLPFFTPHPEHELDYGRLELALVKMMKAGERRMKQTQAAVDAIEKAAK